jgi:NAD kinase
MLVPRIVLVTRPTEIEALVAMHGTLEQAKFILRSQGRGTDDLEVRHERLKHAVAAVTTALPNAWRRVRLDRSELSRFVFENDDVIVPVGPDGLVANVAKYLDGQPVIGVNPDPSSYEGVLVTHRAECVVEKVHDVLHARAAFALRTMVEARFGDGQRLLALNEIFMGHVGHQSARYELSFGDSWERQSSSGIIVATGTGATGWARSIDRERGNAIPLPAPLERRVAYFVREAFPGSGFHVDHTGGLLAEAQGLIVRSEMNEGGVVFGDGIEDDRVEFGWGTTATVGVANERLRLVAA